MMAKTPEVKCKYCGESGFTRSQLHHHKGNHQAYQDELMQKMRNGEGKWKR